MPSEYYQRCFEAILGRKQTLFAYRGRQAGNVSPCARVTKGRRCCWPISSAAKPAQGFPAGAMALLSGAEIHGVDVREGKWHTGTGHSQTWRRLVALWIWM